MAGESVQNGKFFFLFFSPPPLSREGSTPPWRCGAGFTSKGVALRTPCVPRASPPPKVNPRGAGGGKPPSFEGTFFRGLYRVGPFPGARKKTSSFGVIGEPSSAS